MPSLSLYGGSGVFHWTINELSSNFNTANYMEAGIALYSVSYESSYINGRVSYVTAPSSGTSKSVGQVNVSYTAGTFTFYAYARAANGYYYPVGSASVTILSSRPQNWNWTNTFIVGQNINISASEWNNFCSRINEFRRYKGLSNYSFTLVYSGQNITASVANEARAAIRGISGYGNSIPYIYAGDTISVSYFNTLRSGLNDIL